MEWDLQWGTKEKREFLKKLKEQGHDPEALKNKPRLRPWVADCYAAFQMLSNSRPVGMGGVGPIPISEMLAYFETFEIHDPEERETYITMIQALDSVYLAHVNKPVEASGGAQRPPRKR